MTQLVRDVIIGKIQSALRRNRIWVDARTLVREGFGNAARRKLIQKRILRTRPHHTAASGPVGIHVLTTTRDHVNLIWALKSFYHFTEADYSLSIHDGGLRAEDFRTLSTHFPDARMISASEADERVDRFLRERELTRCLVYRKQNPTMRKVFDFYIYTESDYVISIDSDIVFFRDPVELRKIERQSVYNKDMQYAYSLPLGELHRRFGLSPLPLINSGLFRTPSDIMDFARIEEWLHCEPLFSNKWVTEQTIHALSATLAGPVSLLPDSYQVDTNPGLRPDAVCKHYPGYFRPLLYQEGMSKFWTIYTSTESGT